MNRIGEQIKQLRRSRKLTQSEFAERIRVTKSAVSAYENDTRLPSYDVLVRIARLFHVSVDLLLGYNDRVTLDVTGLTQEQINTIQDVVDTYKEYNRMREALGETESAKPEEESLYPLC